MFKTKVHAQTDQHAFDGNHACNVVTFNVIQQINNVASGGSTYKSSRRAPPPKQDQILLFLHMFSPKSTCVGGWCPLQRGLAPPQQEILDPPLVALSYQKCILISAVKEF